MSISLKRAAICVISIVLACMCLMPAQADAASDGSVYVNVSQNYYLAQETLKCINKERTERGLNKLKLDVDLTKSAITRAAEVALYIPDTSPHKRPNGKLVKTLNSRIRYECCLEGEGVLPADAVKEWMGSKPHKKGILLSSAKSVGIACVTIADGYNIYTLEFSDSKVKKIQKSTAIKKYAKKVTAKSEFLKKSYFKLNTASTMYPGLKKSAEVVYSGPKGFGTSIISAKSFTWSSSDTKIATVDKNGKITAKKSGTVTIKAKLKTGSKFTLKKKITVKNISSYQLGKRKQLYDFVMKKGTEYTSASGGYRRFMIFNNSSGMIEDDLTKSSEGEALYLIAYTDRNELRLCYQHYIGLYTRETEAEEFGDFERKQVIIADLILDTDDMKDPIYSYIEKDYTDGDYPYEKIIESADGPKEYTLSGSVDRKAFEGEGNNEVITYNAPEFVTGDASEEECRSHANETLTTAAELWDAMENLHKNMPAYSIGVEDINLYTLGFTKMKHAK